MILVQLKIIKLYVIWNIKKILLKKNMIKFLIC